MSHRPCHERPSGLDEHLRVSFFFLWTERDITSMGPAGSIDVAGGATQLSLTQRHLTRILEVVRIA